MWPELFKKLVSESLSKPSNKPEDINTIVPKPQNQRASIFNDERSYNKAVSLDYFVEEPPEDPI